LLQELPCWCLVGIGVFSTIGSELIDDVGSTSKEHLHHLAVLGDEFQRGFTIDDGIQHGHCSLGIKTKEIEEKRGGFDRGTFHQMGLPLFVLLGDVVVPGQESEELVPESSGLGNQLDHLSNMA
jgi:hypothetical protein